LLHDSNLISEVADEDEALKELLEKAVPDSSKLVNLILKEGQEQFNSFSQRQIQEL